MNLPTVIAASFLTVVIPAPIMTSTLAKRMQFFFPYLVYTIKFVNYMHVNKI